MPGFEDIEDRFFYTALQPVQDGLVPRLREYPGYTCFHDAAWGVERKYRVVNWGAYNAARRLDPNVAIRNYTEIIPFKFARLPGYEAMSQPEYAKRMNRILEARRVEIVAKRYREGKQFMGREKLLKIVRGSRPHKTKTSTRNSHRPRILSVCNKRRAAGKAWYFATFRSYKEASREFRSGKLDVVFPSGTYRPYLPFPLLTKPPPD